MGSSRRRFLALAGASAALPMIGVSGCRNLGWPIGKSEASASASGEVPKEVMMSYPPGLGYAALGFLREKRILEEKFPDTKISWSELPNSPSIREGLLSNRIQVGAMGGGAYLIGFGNGEKIKILSALPRMDCWLMVKDPRIQGLKDFREGDRIGVPSLDSVQAIALREACLLKLGSRDALKGNIQSTSHPEGYLAFKQGKLAGHFTSVPFQLKEEKAGGRILLKSSRIFRQTPSLGGVVMTERFYKENRVFSEFLYEALDIANESLRNPKTANQRLREPETAVEVLARESKGKSTVEEMGRWLGSEAIEFNSTPLGLLHYGELMKESGLVNKIPASINEITFLHDKGGS